MRCLRAQVWDLATYVVVALLALGVFAAYGDRATVGSAEQAAGTLALLLAYGAAVIPLAYCYSFAFASPSAAQACLPPCLFPACRGTLPALSHYSDIIVSEWSMSSFVLKLDRPWGTPSARSMHVMHGPCLDSSATKVEPVVSNKA